MLCCHYGREERIVCPVVFEDQGYRDLMSLDFGIDNERSLRMKVQRAARAAFRERPVSIAVGPNWRSEDALDGGSAAL